MKEQTQEMPARATSGPELEAHVIAASGAQDVEAGNMVRAALAAAPRMWNDDAAVAYLLSAAHEVMTVHQNYFSTFHRVCEAAFEELPSHYTRAVFAQGAALWLHGRLSL